MPATMSNPCRMDTAESCLKRCLVAALAPLTLLAAGCGGSNNSTSTTTTPPPPPPPPVISVQLNQSSATISTQATQQFTATVTGTSNTAVTWSVDSTQGGSSSVGTISGTGLYTAPAQFGTHTVTATSAADKTKSASATVTVLGSLSITPANPVVGAGATQQFSAAVQGETGGSFTWTVDGVTGGNSTVGTISSAGLYTAPAQSGSHTLSATLTSDTSATASTAISVFTLSVSPVGVTLLDPATTQQFTAAFAGTSSVNVTWSVDGVAGGSSTTGTISTTGLYTAPMAIGPHTITVSSVAYPSVSAMSQITVINASTGAVLTYHNDDARDGAFTDETTLTTTNVKSTKFGKLVSFPVDGQIYAQPLYLPQINMGSFGTRDVAFVETQNNSVYAFDADATSTQATTFWHVNLGPPISVQDSGGPWPAVGILSTPVIDVTTNTMYLLAHISGGTGAPFWLHAINVTTGADQPGSPVELSATFNGDSLSYSCYQRMGLALNPITNWIYIPFGSCDHGWVLAYDKQTLTQTAVFDDTNGAAGGGLWSSGGAVAIDDTNGNVYLETGTDYDDQWISPPPAYTQTGYNDSFLNLDPKTLAVNSYFSPDNNWALSETDADLGSGSPVLIPGNSQYPNEIVGGGKDGNVYVLDPQNMGGFNAVNNVLQSIHIGTQQYDNIFSTPVYWNGTLYYHSNQDVVRAFSWTAAGSTGQQLSTQSTSAGATSYSMHGATGSISANGTNSGILWDIDNSAYIGDNPAGSGPSVLHAYDATNLATELYNSTQAGTRDTAGLALKFTVPTIAKGRVYVPTASELDIYGLLP